MFRVEEAEGRVVLDRELDGVSFFNLAEEIKQDEIFSFNNGGVENRSLGAAGGGGGGKQVEKRNSVQPPQLASDSKKQPNQKKTAAKEEKIFRVLRKDGGGDEGRLSAFASVADADSLLYVKNLANRLVVSLPEGGHDLRTTRYCNIYDNVYETGGGAEFSTACNCAPASEIYGAETFLARLQAE